MRAADPLPMVAVIEDKVSDRRRMMSALSSRYRVLPLSHLGSAACLFQARPQVVFVDESTLSGGRQDVIRTLKLDPQLSGVPVILTVEGDGRDALALAREVGANGWIEKPFRRDVLLQTASAAVNLAIEAKWDALPEAPRAALEKTSSMFRRLSSMIERRELIEYEAVKDACLSLVGSTQVKDLQNLLDGVKGYDDYTYVHSLKVAAMLSVFGDRIGLTEEQVVVLAAGGLLHDVGKMAVPREVLNKPGRLTTDEWKVMKRHVTASVRQLQASPAIPETVVAIAEQHHEKLDGTGYPRGLCGRELDELARMSSIVDIFSALTDRRVYKIGMRGEKALLLMMSKQMQAHLDSRFVNIFRSIVLDEGLTF